MNKDFESLAPQTRALIRSQMTRRSLLIGAGAVVGAGTLAACGTGGTSTESATVVDVSDE
jgi:spermidine/putrescine transport system substrate-binding protein